MRTSGKHPRRKYVPQRTLDVIVEEKINILKDFCIINNKNEDAVRADFTTQLKKIEHGDLDYAADRIAKRYMSAAWNGI